MNTSQNNSDDLSISAGGPFNKALEKIRLHENQKKLAIVAVAICWLPLLLIAAFEGTLFSGVEQPFLKDVTMQVRVLIALPMLILIKAAIQTKVIAVVKYISEILLISEEEKQKFTISLKRARKLTSSTVTEIIFLLIVATATASFLKAGVFIGLEGDTKSWLTTAQSNHQNLSLAGYWAVCISIPMFQFLLLRWLWRYVVWMIFLFRISKLNLNLLPTHPDRSGGLGVIMLAQKSFSLLFLAGSMLISGQFVAQLLQDPDKFMTIRGEGIAYIVISLVLIILPLVFFVGKLIEMKNEGLLQLSVLGSRLSHNFEHEWVNDKFTIKKIEEQDVDPSMVFDYGELFDSLYKIRALAANPRDVISLGVMLFVPFMPILFIHFSVAELLERIAMLLI